MSSTLTLAMILGLRWLGSNWRYIKKDIGDFFVPEVYRDVYCRCDLHPRWRPDGRQLAFNSVHEGSRQIYVIDARFAN